MITVQGQLPYPWALKGLPRYNFGVYSRTMRLVSAFGYYHTPEAYNPRFPQSCTGASLTLCSMSILPMLILSSPCCTNSYHSILYRGYPTFMESNADSAEYLLSSYRRVLVWPPGCNHGVGGQGFQLLI